MLCGCFPPCPNTLTEFPARVRSATSQGPRPRRLTREASQSEFPFRVLFAQCNFFFSSEGYDGWGTLSGEDRAGEDKAREWFVDRM